MGNERQGQVPCLCNRVFPDAIHQKPRHDLALYYAEARDRGHGDSYSKGYAISRKDGRTEVYANAYADGWSQIRALTQRGYDSIDLHLYFPQHYANEIVSDRDKQSAVAYGLAMMGRK